MNRLAFSPERLVHSDIELASNLSDSDDPASGSKAQGYVVNRMNILPQRNYNCEASRSTTNINSAYVIGEFDLNIMYLLFRFVFNHTMAFMYKDHMLFCED